MNCIQPNNGAYAMQSALAATNVPAKAASMGGQA